MSDQPEFTLPKEIENAVQVIFSHHPPDAAFVDRLGDQLSAQVKQFSTQGHKVKALFSTLAWGSIGLILILSLIWGINTLLPTTEPWRIAEPSPSPSALPTSQLPPKSTISLDHAVFYSVVAGDTIASIGEKTSVPVETIQDLNVFVLQANNLVAGLKLLIGFKGQVPLFYTVQENDTVKDICAQANISIEEFDTLNRLNASEQGQQNSGAVSQYTLIPGIRVMVGLENLDFTEIKGLESHLIILSETDLDCDTSEERILGIESPEIPYFGITPQLSAIILEKSSSTGFEKVWQLTAQDTGAAYLAYQVFQAEVCNRFLVVLSHKGKEGVNVYRLEGDTVRSVLRLSGRFLFEGDWMIDIFGDYQKSPNTLYLGELQQATSSAKNIWNLRGYQWIDGEFKLIIERRIESSAGG
jgi:LysM repeat protein